jgi:predicted phage baseplate assembly protein
MNIRAVYRKGIGSGGNVAAGQLTQALDRPQGLAGVTNPDPATGGADPATAADARTSAPLNVLTLGRVVSLEDYQNYALAFAGISKALATSTWSGRTRGVFLTVAGANGDVFQADDPVLGNLKTSLWNVGNPYVPLQVVSYVPVLFEVGANVLIDQNNYDPTQVLAQVWQSLLSSFSFAARQLGQGVAQSEILACIQQTPGVIAVELTAFNRQGQAPPPGKPLPPVLRASAPAPSQTGPPKGAEMLLIDPACQGDFVKWVSL